jgi:uncharacterized protein (DUF362 family)/Pyruvate/2-oxoacid:ferredoxin oxidoreductase delta subunit
MVVSKQTVVLVKCENYDPLRVSEALQRGIDLLGGVHRFFHQGERVLLKPNVLWGSDPSRCIVTHPAVFKGIAKILLNSGTALSYGDSPGGVLPASFSMKQTGLAAAAEELGIPLADFDHGKNVSYPKGVTSRNLTIANGVLDAQGVLSLPKLKTHGLTRMTGAVKNQFGCVPGLVKGEYHVRFIDPLEFSRLLVDITGYVGARLYIMDAIMAMEGNGPQSGDPKKLGVLLLSDNPVAIDAVACRIINLDPTFVPTLVAGKQAGLGDFTMNEIELLGDPLESFVDKQFKVVRLPVRQIPKSGLLKILGRMTIRQPIIRKELCIRCGKCIEACPLKQKALSWKKGEKKDPPVYDYSICIRCFCCHEMCPSRAIYIRMPFMGRVLPVVNYIGLLLTNLRIRQKRGQDG